MALPTTIDALLNGALVVEQPAPGYGYRANVDALWLARFASDSAGPHRHVVDLGAGVGTVALAIHLRSPAKSITFVEQDQFTAGLSQRNAAHLGVSNLATTVVDDVDSWARSAAPAPDWLVVANPPYTPPGAGRRGGQPSRNAARHGPLEPFVFAIQRLLVHSTNVGCICYPANGALDAIELIERSGLAVCRMRFVHPNAKRPARIVLLELRSDSDCDLRVLPPWIDAGSCDGP